MFALGLGALVVVGALVMIKANRSATDELAFMPDGTGAAAPVKDFTVTGKNFSFDPPTLAVALGDKVRITFKNVEGFHDFILREFGAATKQIRSGEEDVVEFIADKTGTFEYYCSVGNHRAMGMKGTLTVK